MSKPDKTMYPAFEYKILVDLRCNGEEVAHQHLRNLRDYIMTMQYSDGISVFLRKVPKEPEWKEI